MLAGVSSECALHYEAKTNIIIMILLSQMRKVRFIQMLCIKILYCVEEQCVFVECVLHAGVYWCTSMSVL